MKVVYKKKIKVLDDFCGHFGPHNCVSMRKQGTHCIAHTNKRVSLNIVKKYNKQKQIVRKIIKIYLLYFRTQFFFWMS